MRSAKTSESAAFTAPTNAAHDRRGRRLRASARLSSPTGTRRAGRPHGAGTKHEPDVAACVLNICLQHRGTGKESRSQSFACGTYLRPGTGGQQGGVDAIRACLCGGRAPGTASKSGRGPPTSAPACSQPQAGALLQARPQPVAYAASARAAEDDGSRPPAAGRRWAAGFRRLLTFVLAPPAPAAAALRPPG